MSLIVTDDKHYKNIANALRHKNNPVTGDGRDYSPADMSQAVLDLPDNRLPKYIDKSLTEVVDGDLPGTWPTDRGIFGSFTQLTKVDLSTQAEIFAEMFANCTSLSEVNLPQCYFIDEFAFLGCTSLTSFTLATAGYIGPSAFAESGLTTMIIENIEAAEIHTSAFANSNLANLVIRGSTVANLANTNAFNGTPIVTVDEATGRPGGTIYVPSDLIDTYKAATNWSNLPDSVWAPLNEWDELHG